MDLWAASYWVERLFFFVIIGNISLEFCNNRSIWSNVKKYSIEMISLYVSNFTVPYRANIIISYVESCTYTSKLFNLRLCFTCTSSCLYQLRQLEEIRSCNRSPKSSCASTPSSGTFTSEGQASSVEFSPNSLEKHCRPIDRVVMETGVKGTVVERLDRIEAQVLKVPINNCVKILFILLVLL